MAPVNLAWLRDWLEKRRIGECFGKVKYEQHHLVDMPRFYLVATKCPELAEFDPDWKHIVFLFHMHHAIVDPDDHLVIHFLRSLQS
jgi:hypothetical protein